VQSKLPTIRRQPAEIPPLGQGPRPAPRKVRFMRQATNNGPRSEPMYQPHLGFHSLQRGPIDSRASELTWVNCSASGSFPVDFVVGYRRFIVCPFIRCGVHQPAPATFIGVQTIAHVSVAPGCAPFAGPHRHAPDTGPSQEPCQNEFGKSYVADPPKKTNGLRLVTMLR